MTLLFVVLGTIFGFVLSRSGAADYNFIQSMFLCSVVSALRHHRHRDRADGARVSG